MHQNPVLIMMVDLRYDKTNSQKVLKWEVTVIIVQVSENKTKMYTLPPPWHVNFSAYRL